MARFLEVACVACVLAIFCDTAAAGAEAELKDSAGKRIIRYVVEPPDSISGTSDPTSQLGLILCFPEHDRPVGDEIYPVREALNRLGIRNHYVLLAGGPQARKFGPADHEPIAKLIEWAKKTYPINPRRIYMYGKGEGGKISGEFAMFNPNVVTASISYSWSWWKMPAELKKGFDPVRDAPEMYMVLGLRDLSYHLTNVRDGYSRVHAKGYHVIYREFNDLGARTYHPPSNDDAIAWATRLRNKALPLSEGEQKLLKAKPAIGPEGYFTSIALVGGTRAGEVLQTLLHSKDSSIRAAAADTFIHGIFSEAAIQSLGQGMTDESSAVRRSTFRALAVNANWRSQAAQDLLTSFLADPAKAIDPRDRVAAADAIVQAVRTQIRGARQDPGLFGALISLLDDKDEELRTIASNTLASIRDPQFRGDLGRPEQKMPDGGWAAWLAHLTKETAGYRHAYASCGSASDEASRLFCEGGASLTGKDLATGKPVEIDAVRAFELTRKAAEQGNHPAEAMLGMMYVTAKGVEQDLAEGARWLAKAADSGDALAATNAAMLYKGAPGLAADKNLAEKYEKQSKQIKTE